MKFSITSKTVWDKSQLSCEPTLGVETLDRKSTAQTRANFRHQMPAQPLARVTSTFQVVPKGPKKLGKEENRTHAMLTNRLEQRSGLTGTP